MGFLNKTFSLPLGKPFFYHVQSQQPLRESQEALLKKVDKLTEQLKQERERALTVEGQLTTATLSLQTQEKVSICALILYFRPWLLHRPCHILVFLIFSVTREDFRPGRRERFNKRQLQHFTWKVRGPSHITCKIEYMRWVRLDASKTLKHHQPLFFLLELYPCNANATAQLTNTKNCHCGRRCMAIPTAVWTSWCWRGSFRWRSRRGAGWSWSWRDSSEEQWHWRSRASEKEVGGSVCCRPLQPGVGWWGQTVQQ